MSETQELFSAAGPEFGRPVWLEGRCVSYGESLPYWAYRDLVREWLGAGGDDPELRVRVSLRRAVEALFGDRTMEIYPYLGAMLGLALEPEAAARLAELSPEALQYRTFEVVGSLLARLAEDGPVVVVIEDLHWADTTSVQLTEQLLALTERAAVLFVIAQRPERDHSSWRIKEAAARELPHRTRELALEALSGDAERELLHSLVGAATLPHELEQRVLNDAEGNPFYLEELVGSLVDAGALVADVDGGWRFDHAVPVQVPETVEKVILARIDRLTPECHDVLTAAAVIGRRFGLPLLQGVSGEEGGALQGSLAELQRLDLVREARRWPEPEYRFKHVLIQEAAYRTLLSERRIGLHRRAAEWLEHRNADHLEEAFGLLAHHWLAAEDEGQGHRLPDARGRPRAAGVRAGRGDRPLPGAAAPARTARRAPGDGAGVVQAGARAAHVAALRRGEPRVPARVRPVGAAGGVPGHAGGHHPGRVELLPNDPDPKSAIAWPNIQLCMQLFDRLVEAWPERTIVPSLAERWEIAPDGLRYVFHLREGLRWSDGEPLTAHDVEFGIKRVLDPASPGSSVAIYFVLENGQDYYLGHNADADRIGVRALDDRTVEFRLVAPAPYFMSVMNRPDGGPQPRHAVERDGEDWTDPERQVVSGAVPGGRAARRRDRARAQPGYAGTRPGNAARIEFLRTSVSEALEPYADDDLDMVAVRYTPRLADLVPSEVEDARFGQAGWSGYLAFDHGHPATSNLELRMALAHAVDRERLAAAMPVNMVVATGGIVPPSLQGHTPDIAVRFDPDDAREHLRRSGMTDTLSVACLETTSRCWTPWWRRGARCSTSGSSGGRGRPRRPSATHVRGERRRSTSPGGSPAIPTPSTTCGCCSSPTARPTRAGSRIAPFDELIEQARQERRDRERLELFHRADRMAVTERVAVIPIVYGRSLAIVKPWVHGWWEFGKSSSNFADLESTALAPRLSRKEIDPPPALPRTLRISTEISTAGVVPLFSSQWVVFRSSGQPTPGP